MKEAELLTLPNEQSQVHLGIETGMHMALALLAVFEGGLAHEFGGTIGAGLFHVKLSMTADLRKAFDGWWEATHSLGRSGQPLDPARIQAAAEALATRLRSVAAWLYTASMCSAEALECPHDDGDDLAAGFRALADQCVSMLFQAARLLHQVENHFHPSAPGSELVAAGMEGRQP